MKQGTSFVSMALDWRRVQDAYPVNEELIWLNNCGTTPPGRHVVEQMRDYFEVSSRRGPGTGAYEPGAVRGKLKGSLSALVGVKPDEIALVHNTAEGMSMVSLGLCLKPGDEILLLEDEYPSNVYPWQSWQEHGVTLEFLPTTSTPREFVDQFRRAVGSNTRVAALSAVHWCSGMPLPLREIADICHDRGVLLAVDGSQGVGNVPVDMQSLAPCVLCFSTWKWLLGPLGLGVLAISSELLDTLRPVFKGPDAVADPASYLPYQTAFRATADRYTYSTANFSDWVYLSASLDLLGGIGFEQVRTRIHELTALLWQGLERLGFRSAYDRMSAPSGILAVEKPGVDSARLAVKLVERGIVVRERLGRLRLAPHVYLSPDQIVRAVDTIAELI